MSSKDAVRSRGKKTARGARPTASRPVPKSRILDKPSMTRKTGKKHAPTDSIAKGGHAAAGATPRTFRFAAIDNGSNAIRLKIIEARSATEVRVLHVQRFPVRLGHDVFQTGRLDPGKVSAALRVYRTARKLCEAHKVPLTQIRAVGTSAVRDASNGEDFCARVHRESGIKLEPISGAEEARLVRAALRRTLDLRAKRALLLDLGGGSLEISVLVSEETRFSTSLEVGTVRVLEAFLQGGRRITREQELMVQELIDRALLPVLPDVRALAPNVAAGVGGNFEALAELCPSPDARGPGIHCAGLDQLLDALMRLPLAERRRRFNLRPDRADVIVPATFIIRRLSQVFDIRRIATPGVGLREGLLHQRIDQHFGAFDYTEEALEISNAARALGRRYQYDEAHAEQTERFALRLFDDLAELHHYGPAEREILRLAALLHDVGTFISTDRHHRHTHYIIAHSELGGLPREQRELVARVARFHRKSPPTPKHALLVELPRADQDRVMKLSALLRLADAFDREHRGAVLDVRALVDHGKVHLRIVARDDPALEIWTAQHKADLFERVFGLPLHITTR